MKRHFLMLAHKYDPNNHSIGGFYCSEKLDGMRCFWDGGVTKGMELKNVPFANIDKDARYRVQPKATGLWTRYGKSIQAPDWFLNALPNTMLDGELWTTQNDFQSVISITKQLSPGAEWSRVKFKVFDSPLPDIIFDDGSINEPMFKKKFSNILYSGLKFPSIPHRYFKDVYKYLQDQPFWNNIVQLHEQKQLDYRTSVAQEQVNEILLEVESRGGEGLMLRNMSSQWIPERTWALLKVKSLQDAEAVVVGYTAGRETNLGSKLLGIMGALIVRFNDKEFELSGFTDEERKLTINGDYLAAREYCEKNPGKRLNISGLNNPTIPLGSKITFKYRELTVDGVPREARFWRKA